MSTDIDRPANHNEESESEPLRNFAQVPFVKMSGSGNDFIVVDNRNGFLPEEILGAWTLAVCRRRVSMGADGVVFIEDYSAVAEPDTDFVWRYFNADGSEGEMCGNGAMCGAHVAFSAGIADSEMRFQTLSGSVSAQVETAPWGSRVWLDLPDTGVVGEPVAIELTAGIDQFLPVDVGVPHAVAIVEDADAFMDEEAFDRYGRAIRHDAVFAPRGTNVNMISIHSDSTVRMRTWERGVEAETLACGTGAVASALIAVLAGDIAPPVTVRTTSGEDLIVDFTLSEAQQAINVRLGGRVVEVARGIIEAGALI